MVQFDDYATLLDRLGRRRGRRVDPLVAAAQAVSVDGKAFLIDANNQAVDNGRRVSIAAACAQVDWSGQGTYVITVARRRVRARDLDTPDDHHNLPRFLHLCDQAGASVLVLRSGGAAHRFHVWFSHHDPAVLDRLTDQANTLAVGADMHTIRPPLAPHRTGTRAPQAESVVSILEWCASTLHRMQRPRAAATIDELRAAAPADFAQVLEHGWTAEQRAEREARNGRPYTGEAGSEQLSYLTRTLCWSGVTADQAWEILTAAPTSGGARKLHDVIADKGHAQARRWWDRWWNRAELDRRANPQAKKADRAALAATADDAINHLVNLATSGADDNDLRRALLVARIAGRMVAVGHDTLRVAGHASWLTDIASQPQIARDLRHLVEHGVLARVDSLTRAEAIANSLAYSYAIRSVPRTHKGETGTPLGGRTAPLCVRDTPQVTALIRRLVGTGEGDPTPLTRTGGIGYSGLRALLAVAAERSATADEIAERSGASKRTTFRRLAGLVDAGLVANVDGRYRLADAVQDALDGDPAAAEAVDQAVTAAVTDRRRALVEIRSVQRACLRIMHRREGLAIEAHNARCLRRAQAS